MRPRICSLMMLVSLGICLFSVSEAFAQRRFTSPAGPPISPYMEFFRLRTGPLDNYNQFVRPRVALNNNLSQQQAGLRAMQGQVGNMQSFLRRAEETGFQSGPTLPPTGRVPTSMNYSHFFPGMGGRR
jgi:hypothetical protein